MDVTGILAGVLGATLGLFVFPSRRKKAKESLAARLEELRTELMTNLRDQFSREMRRSNQRLDDTVAPFSRFVRAERTKLESQRNQLLVLEEHLLGLHQQAGSV